MNTLTLKQIDTLAKQVAEKVLPQIVEETGCGFFDGGCYTFAKTLCDFLNSRGLDARMMNIGRAPVRNDHAVVWLPELTPEDAGNPDSPGWTADFSGAFVDADGVASISGLEKKMRQEELTRCRGIWPLTDDDTWGQQPAVGVSLRRELERLAPPELSESPSM